MISSPNEPTSIDWNEFQYAKYDKDGTPMNIDFDVVSDEPTKESQYDLY